VYSEGSPETFWKLVSDAAAASPGRVLLADDHGRSLTTAGLRDAAERVAAGLPAGPGTVVSWQLPTTIEAVVLLAALARLGAVQNPVVPVLREREVGLIAKAVGTELFITAEKWRGFGHAAMARDLGLDVIGLDLESDPGGGLRLPAGAPASGSARWSFPSPGARSRWPRSRPTAAPRERKGEPWAASDKRPPLSLNHVARRWPGSRRSRASTASTA
jgi:cyclohexanecarboxylate-CoA ligase